MTCYIEVRCHKCNGNQIKKAGRSTNGEPRYICLNKNCDVRSFMLNYRYRAYHPEIKQQVVEMAINGSGIRDTARVLGIHKNTVSRTIKKRRNSLRSES